MLVFIDSNDNGNITDPGSYRINSLVIGEWVRVTIDGDLVLHYTEDDFTIILP